MQWMTSKKSDLKIALAGGNVNRLGTLDSPEMNKKYTIEVPALRECLKICNPDWRPLIPEWDQISQQILGLALPAVISGDKTAKVALDAVVPDVEAVVRKGGWLKT